MEAGACGIPIITTKVGEIPFLWEDQKNIIIVDSFEGKDFAQAAIEIFEDQNLAKKLSKEGRINAEKFSWENIKKDWIKLLEN